jgi:eukaryotic-like serine/threonine-protein kinase
MARSSPISIGDTLALRLETASELPCRVKQWELVELAAQGSLARVWRARPAGSPEGRPAAYAVKMLQTRWADDPRAVELFRREAAVGRQVVNPHVISVLDASLAAPPRLLVMPWLQGWTLKKRLERGSRLELHAALWIARQAAIALEALHQAGWMHGDVKPSNLFLSPRGHVTLLDLGFARREVEMHSAVDRCVMGTCNYLAPELITSALRGGICSDVYSLGVVLYQALSGRLPFAGPDLASLATQHRSTAPPHLGRLVPELPAEVVELVHQMLAKDPLRRPHPPAELINRLTALEIEALDRAA